MGTFFSKIINFYNKGIFIAIFISTLILVLIFHNWLFVQIEHVVSYYYVYAGDQDFKKGHLQEAINDYNRALRLYPEHTKARYNLGNIYVAYEDFDSAATCYEKALEVYPNFLNARINLGIILSEELFNIDQAIVEYQRVIDSRPLVINIPFLYNNSTYIKNSKALAYYNMGLAFKAKSLLSGGNKYLSRYNLEKAAESYRRSIKIEYNNYDCHYNLAISLHLLGNQTEALEEYCRSIYISPLSYESHYNLAMLLKQKKQYRQSMLELEKAGLLLDERGDTFKTQFIYQMLNDVSQRNAMQREYTLLSAPKQSDEDLTNDIIYVKGKAVLSEKFGQNFYNYMRSCSSCDFIKSEK